MIRKIIKLGMPLALVIGTVVSLSAFEAHVVNVTAKIENALAMSTEAIDFGTVFPQEQLERRQLVSLSQSFLAEDRVDDVEYFIRQKLKCAITIENGTILVQPPVTATGHVVLGDNPETLEVEEYWIDCGRPPRRLMDVDLPETQVNDIESWGLLPSLCPYLSKHPDNVPENDGSTPSFHQPFYVGNNQPIVWHDTPGRLAKSENDIEDIWTIDLKVPCFGDHCAQDWADFVHGINPNANPDDYDLPIELEHKIFGCDLWFEVSGVSEANGPTDSTTGTLIVIKEVVNLPQGSQGLSAGDFTIEVTGLNPSDTTFPGAGAPGTQITLDPGAYTVGEVPPAGYAVDVSDPDCAGTIAAGETRTCTVVNTEQPVIAPQTGTLTLLKEVVGPGQNPNDNAWTLVATGPDTISGKEGQAAVTNAVVTTGDYVLTEESGPAGFSLTGIECVGGTLVGSTVTVGAGADVTCTFTNTEDT